MNQEDRIQEALKALAAADAAKQASAETEASVLEEFRRLQSLKAAGLASARELQVPGAQAANWYRPAFWALAGAAVMFLMVLGWRGWSWGIGAGTPQEQTATRSVGQAEVQDSSAVSRGAEAGVDLADAGSPQEQRERSVIAPPSAPVEKGPREIAGRGSRAIPASLTNGPRALTNGPPPKSLMPPASGDALTGNGMEEPLTVTENGEVATDFFPLLEVIPPFERGRILRTTVPAATMREVGLWVHPDRLYEPVEADVLVGNDGIARAIRFVGRAPDGSSAVPALDHQ